MDTYQEIKCPFCGHRYVERLLGDYDVEIKNNPPRYGWHTACPKCGADVIAVKGEPEGLNLSSIPESEYTEVFSLK